MNKKPSHKEILSIILLASALVLAIAGSVFVWMHLVIPYAIIFFSLSVAIMVAFVIIMPKNKKKTEGTDKQNKDNDYLEQKRYEPEKKDSLEDDAVDNINEKR